MPSNPLMMAASNVGAWIRRAGDTMLGTLAMGISGIVRWAAQTADSAPLVGIVRGGDAWSRATGANRTGAMLALAGGIGTKQCTSLSNTAGAVTITFNVQDGTSVALASGVAFVLGTDNTAPQLAVTATNLAAAINGHATLGPLLAAVADAATVYIQPKDGCYRCKVTTSQAARISVVESPAGYARIADALKIGGATILDGAGVNYLDIRNAGATVGLGFNLDADKIQFMTLAGADSATVEAYKARFTRFVGNLAVGLEANAAGQWKVTDGASTSLGVLNLVRLGSAQIDLNSGAKQNLFSVPTGKTYIPLFVLARTPSAALAAGTTWGYGRDANASDFFAPAALGALFSATTKAHVAHNDNATAINVASATDNFGVKVTVTEAGKTIYVDVYGVIV